MVDSGVHGTAEGWGGLCVSPTETQLPIPNSVGQQKKVTNHRISQDVWEGKSPENTPSSSAASPLCPPRRQEALARLQGRTADPRSQNPRLAEARLRATEAAADTAML